MTPDVTISVISFVGTLFGTFAGIIASNRLTNYRIEQLEKKVDKHNSMIERMAVVETSLASAHQRIDEMEETFKSDCKKTK